MKTIYRITGIILILVSFLGTDTIQAQRNEGKRNRGTSTHRDYDTKRSVRTNHYRGIDTEHNLFTGIHITDIQDIIELSEHYQDIMYV